MKKKHWLMVGGAAVLTAVVLFSPLGDGLLYRLGPFHVLILHLPIGILAIAALMAIRGWVKQSKDWEEQIKFTLLWSAISGVIAAVLGWMLYYTGGYSGNALLLHQWLGTATAVALILQWRLYPRFDRLLFGLSLPLLMLTGHFGGTLTHGEDFLTKAPASSQSQKQSSLDEAVAFADLIQPMLEQKCISCHNTSKQKGGLVLLDSTSIHAGGENGTVLVSGNAEGSTLIQLVESSVHEERHMPPKGREQLTSSEINLMKWWVDQGAPFSSKVKEIPQTPAMTDLLEKHFAVASPLLALNIPFADVEELDALKAAGIRVEQLSPEQPYLRVNLSDRQDLTPDLIEQIEGVAEQVTMLDLGESNVDDEMLEEIEIFPHLQSLRLDQTKVSDKGLKLLEQFEFLQDLDLSRTQVSCDVFESLTELEYLESINVWQSTCSAEQLAEIQEKHANWNLEYGQLTSLFADSKLFPPKLDTAIHLFMDSLSLVLENPYPGAEIRYTLDGSEVEETTQIYEPGIFIHESLVLKARCTKENWESSEQLVHQFVRISGTQLKSLRESEADERYPGQGTSPLLDLQVGKADFKDAAWTGYFGEDFKGIYALSEIREVHQVIVHNLEDVGSWILLPSKIRVSAGKQRNAMKVVAEFEPEIVEKMKEVESYFFTLDFEPVEARFIQVEVSNFGELPDWHVSGGNPSWLFIDEILVD